MSEQLRPTEGLRDRRRPGGVDSACRGALIGRAPRPARCLAPPPLRGGRGLQLRGIAAQVGDGLRAYRIPVVARRLAAVAGGERAYRGCE